MMAEEELKCVGDMDEKEVRSVDDILQVIGSLRKFTICQIAALFIGFIPLCFQLMGNVFIADAVPYRCEKPANESSLLVDVVGKGDNLTITYEQCHIVVYSNRSESVLKRDTCVYGVHYELPKDASVISTFDLVCEFSSLVGFSQTLVFLGQGAGAVLATMASDKYGRKKVVVLCHLGLFAIGFGVGFAPNYACFATFKFFAGAFQQGVVTVVMTLAMEILTTKNRKILAWLFNLSWAVVVMSLPLWAYLLRNYSWRIRQLALTVGPVFVFFQFWHVKESLRWLIANGKSKEAIAYIKHATSVNKTDCEHALQVFQKVCKESDDPLLKGVHAQNVSSEKLTLIDLLKDRRLFINAVVMWFAWFTTALSYFALYLTSTSLAGNPFLNFFLVALMESTAAVYLYFTIQRIGRKLSMIGAFTMVSVGLIASGIFRFIEANSVNSAFSLISALLAMTGASSSFAAVYFYTPELFPTNIRSQALGVSSMMGRVGAMIAPFTGVVSEKAKWGPGLLIGTCACLVSLLLVFLPETKGRELPQTLQDLQSWYKTDKKHEDLEPDND